jgi:glycosyl transferase family 25
MQSFVITLINNTASVAFSQNTISSAKKYSIDCEIWPAIDGSTISIDCLREDYGISTILKKSMVQRPGVLGCFLSHYSLWQHCIKINEPIIILEHDTEIIRNIPTNIVDYFDDVLKLDAYKVTDINYHNLVENSLTETPNYITLNVDGTSKAGDYSLGAYGYIVKPSGAKKLINFSKTNGILPTDLHIASNVVNIKETTVSFVCLQKTHNWSNIKELSSTTDLITFGKK